MPNFVSLNAGLRQGGDTASRVGQFLQNQQSLEIDQQRANDYSQQVDLQKREQAEKFRLQANTEFSRAVLQSTTEASRARKPDGSTFNTFGEYLDSEQGAKSRELIVNGLANSNSRYRASLGGKPIRSVKGKDGRHIVQVQEGADWVDAKGADGQSVSFTGDELAQKARFDMASAGVAEVIYFKREAQRALSSGQITQAQYQEQIQQLQQQGQQLQQGVTKAGMDFDQVVESAIKGDPGHQDMPPEAFAQIMADEPPAKAAGMEASTQQAGANVRTALGEDFMADSTIAKGARGFASMLGMDLNPTTSKQVQAGGVDATITAKDSTLAGVKANTEIQINPEQAPKSEFEQLTSAITAPADRSRLVAPPATEPPAAMKQMHTKRADVVLDRAATGAGSPETARDAAIAYANGMIINGYQPNPQILANLYAGDDMAGTGQQANALRAKYDIQYMKNHAAAVKANATNAATSLAIRKQIIVEREKASNAAAEAAIHPGVSDRTEHVKQMTALIDNGFSIYASELGHLGYMPSELPSSLATLPQFAQVFAKYYKEDLAISRYNDNEKEAWFPNLKEHKTLMDKVMKEVYVMDPRSFTERVYNSVIAEHPDRAPDDPANIDQARQIIQHYKTMQTPQEVYQDAE
jgi:hypothetical protein